MDIEELLDNTITNGDNNDDDDDGEEELVLTPGEVIKLMEEIWLNEKFAPELLPHRNEIIGYLIEQIVFMEKNLETLTDGDFKKSIHTMELDRVRFMIKSYLRIRLEKIETYIVQILKDEEQRFENDLEGYLMEGELEFARNYMTCKMVEEHLSSCVSYGNSLDECKNNWMKPNMNTFVFVKSKSDVEGIAIDDGTDTTDLVDFNNGSQSIISYKSVGDLVKRGDVKLV